MLTLVVLCALAQVAEPAKVQPEEANRQAMLRLVDIAAGRAPKPHAPKADPESPQAAGRYIALIQSMPKGLYEQAGCVNYDADKFGVSEYCEGVTAESASKALEAAQPWIKKLCEAAALDQGDLRLGASWHDAGMDADDPGRGLNTGLLHSIRILRADACRLADKGATNEAMERVVAQVGIARHLSQERYSFIAGIVGGATLEGAAARFEMLRARDGGAANSATLKKMLQDFERSDPAGIREAWRGRSKFMIEFAEKCSEGKEVTLPLLTELAEARTAKEMFGKLFDSALAGKDVGKSLALDAGDAAKLSAQLREQLGDLTPQQVRKATARAREMIQEAEVAWDKPEAESVLKRISDEVSEDETELLMVMVSYPRATREGWLKSVSALKRLSQE